MRLKRVYTESELYDGIWVAFYGDYDLMEKFHDIGDTFENCVADTFLSIQNATSKKNTEWFHIIIKDEVIGYIVASKINSFLYSFGVNEKYRISDNIELWFFHIRKILGYEYTCALWAKNVQSINFLTKNGMKLYAKSEEMLIHNLN